MGFYATEPECERREKMHAPPAKPSGEDGPPSKNRVWGFSATSRNRTRRSEPQVLEPQQENRPTPTATASGVLFYGLRYYNPELGRWVNRDPIGERGGLNVYGFVLNRPKDKIDFVGLRSLGDCVRASTFTISISEPIGSPVIAIGSPSGQIGVQIDVELDADACECICEHPRFAQEKRKSAWYWWVGWVELGGWSGDGWGGPAPGGGTYYNVALGRRFRNGMSDFPGRSFGSPARTKIELYTRIVCAAGSEKDTTIRSIRWGIDVDGYLTLSGWKYDKNWWPSGPYPLAF